MLARLVAAAIVRGFAGDGDVVDVAFTQSGAGDAAEFRVVAQITDGRRSGVAHGRLQPTDQLMDDRADGAFVRYPAFDAFRNQF